jgi:DNA-binding response OmpR family regulator
VQDQIIRKTFGEKVIERDDSLRLLTVIFGSDKVNLHFTPIEYRILKVLLEHPQVSDAELIGHLRTKGSESSRMLLRHINNIRGQLRCADLDILRIHQFGYMLNDLNLQATQSAI